MKKTNMIVSNFFKGLIVLLLILGCGSESRAQDPKPRMKLGAYYFGGWAGRNASDDGKPEHAWAAGMPTHYTKRMSMEFPGREPLWGWRDDTQALIDRQINLAADHGISFFAFDWYWSDNNGPINLAKIEADSKHVGMRLFMNSTYNNRMDFCLMVSNHEGFEITGLAAWKQATDYWIPIFKHKSYLKVDGKPLVIIFYPQGADKGGLDYLQEQARQAGYPGVFIVGIIMLGGVTVEDGYMATTRYVTTGTGKYSERHSFQDLINANVKDWKGTAELPCIPVITAGWDRRPWEGPDGFHGGSGITWYFDKGTYDQYVGYLNSLAYWMDSHPEQITRDKLAIIGTWNEIGEGSWILPSKDDPEGTFLKAVKAVNLDKIGNGTIRYVKPLPGTSGDGSSWAQAYIGGDGLKSAIAASSIGDEIWVMAGTYYPSSTDNRGETFVLKTGVTVYGGFAGTETLLSQRNWVSNVTTLSGDIGVAGVNTDNTYNVFRITSTSEEGTLDGFTVSGGYCVGAVSPGYVNGGGMFSSISCTINNCIFENNAAAAGGGLYLYNTTATAITPVLNNCIIRFNTASSSYGGLCSHQRVSARMDKCTISENTALTGGGIGISAAAHPAIFNMTDSKIINNTSSGPNGAGGLHVISNVAAAPANINLTNCEISGNIVTNAAAYGGGIFLSPNGTGVAGVIEAATFTNCLVKGNKAFKGAGIYISAAAGNTSTSNYSFINCTIAKNLAEGVGSSGGGINFNPISATSTLTLNNSIVWGNTTTDGTLGQQIFRLGGADPVINKSCISNAANDNEGVTIPGTSLTTDPLFVSESDFRLQSSSPAINFGDDALNSTVTDIRGTGFARKVGTIDLGAYEYYLPTKANLVSLSNTSIYPTVTEGIINIASAVKPKSIQLYSITGKALKRWSETNVIDISDLAKGIYLIRLTNNNGNVATYKVLKQ